MPSINLGLANKVKKSYQGIDLDKKREETIEGIGHSYVKTISWVSFLNKLLTFCDEHNIKILKKYEDSESGCMKFHSKSIDILPSGLLKFNSKPTDVLPNSISFYIVSRTEETKITQRYDYYNSKSFTKQNNKISKDCYLFINKVAREVNGEKREGLAVYIQYSQKKPDGLDSKSIKGVVLSNSPVIDIEASLKSGYATRGGNLNTPPNGIGWLLCENTVKDLFDLISELKTISAIAEEKYKTTRLAETSIFNLISKNLSDKFKPIVINGRHELKYKYWDTLIESSTALGLSKKVRDKHTNQNYNKVIKDMILDEKSFIRYVDSFIEGWQEENNKSVVPGVAKTLHLNKSCDNTSFATDHRATSYVFNDGNDSMAQSIVITAFPSKKFTLYVSDGHSGKRYHTSSLGAILLDMTPSNFERVFDWIQHRFPDPDDVNESQASNALSLGLSKKVTSRYSNHSYSSVIKEMTLDEETFIKYVTDFIEKWQEENSASAIPQIKDFVHPAPGLRTVFAEKNNASSSVFNVDAKSISRSIIVYVGQEGSEHSGEFSLFVSSNAWGVFYRTTDSRKITGSYPVWLSMTIENFEHVFNWIQTEAPDEDNSMNESTTSSLGLVKKVKKQYQEKNIKDTIENISVLDKSEFFLMCEKIFSPENSEYIVDSKKGIYDSKNDWDFWYIHRKGNDEYPKTAYIRVDGTKQGYMFTFYMNSPFYGTIEFPIGRLNTSFDICNDMVDENVSYFEIWDCLKAMQHMDMTVSNLLKVKDFFEQCCRGDILPGWVNKEYVESYVKKWFSLKESNISLGLSNKVKREYSKKSSDEAVIELSEMSFMEFYNALKNRLEVLGRDWQRDTKGITTMNWWPKDFEDPDTRDQGSRDFQWVSMSFEGIGRFTFRLYSQYQIYPAYKNLAEDTFKASYSYSVKPSEHVCTNKEVVFLAGDYPIQDPDATSFPFFKMTYGNLDKAIQWVSNEIRKPINSTGLKRLVQMS